MAPDQVVSPVAHTNSLSSARTVRDASSTIVSADVDLSPTAEIRTSTASTRAYVATMGFVPRRSASPSRSATMDSPIPASR